jgi:hypothetical protein
LSDIEISLPDESHLQRMSPVRRARAVASIRAFLKRNYGVFDDHATRVTGEAFEAARKKLHSAGQPQIALETIAAWIIGAASKGERDPVLYAMPGWSSWQTTATRPPLGISGPL